jgi:hypothetical protein
VATPEAQAWVAEAMVGIDYIVSDLQRALSDAGNPATEESFS